MNYFKFKNKIRFILYWFLIVAVLDAGFFAPAQTFSQTAPVQDLRQKIEQKSLELRDIQIQKEALEKTLEEINKTSNTLTREMKTIDYNVSQLNLLIKSNKVLIENLELEIEAFKEDIDDTEKGINDKRETIKKLFFELQQKDRENLLTVFLRNKSLSQSVSEIQTIMGLNASLSGNINELKSLEGQLSQKINEESRLKQNKEVEHVNLTSRQVIIQEQKTEKQKLLNQTKNQEKVYEEQLTELEKQQAEVSAEVEKIETELRKTVDPNLLPIARPGVLIWPVNGGRLTQGYGRTAFAIRNYANKYHNGIDIGAPIGTEVFAAESGVVINVGDQDKFCPKVGYGRFIVVKHENGLTTLYGHLSRYLVSIGQKVERGEVIGYLGRTGWATGPHLHFTVFATQTLTPARPGFPEGTSPLLKICGPMPVGGDLDPQKYL